MWLILGYVAAAAGLAGLLAPAYRAAARQTHISFQRHKTQVQASPFYAHLDTMLSLLRPDRAHQVWQFGYQAAVIFAFTLCASFLLFIALPSWLTGNSLLAGSASKIGSPSVGVVFSLMAAGACVTLYYMYIRIRFVFKQIKAGYDLLDVVRTLPRFAHLSVDEALLAAATQLGAKCTLYRPLRLLAVCLTGYQKEEELEAEAKRFAAVVNTTFAVAFISDLLFAVRTGSSWRDSLVALGQSMQSRLSVILDAKREMSDAIQTGLWGNALSLVAICGGLAGVIGWHVYAPLQFQTVVGAGLLLLNLAAIAAGVLIALRLRMPALDYK